MSQERSLAPNILMPFQDDFLTRVEIAEEELDSGGNSHGFLLLGESGTGKSYVFDRLALKYPSRVEGHQRITPFVRYNARAGADFPSLCRGLLKVLGSSTTAAAQKKNEELENSLRNALIKHRTTIVGLEEVHNGLTNEAKQFRSRLRDFLKNLWNFFPEDDNLTLASSTPGYAQRKLIVVVSGTSILKDIFAKHGELHTRYNSVIHARRLRISVEAEFKAFRALLVHFTERFRLSLAFEPSDDYFSMRCYLATAANLRVLERLFERAGSLSRRPRASGQRPEEIFSSALQQVNETQADLFDPFLASTERLTQEFSMELTRQLATVKKAAT